MTAQVENSNELFNWLMEWATHKKPVFSVSEVSLSSQQMSRMQQYLKFLGKKKTNKVK